MKTSAIIRWILAIGILAACVGQMISAFKTPGLGAAGHLILSFGSLLAFLLLISPETIIPGCELFSRLFTSIVLPDDKNRKPPLSYILARRYRKQLRTAEAVEEYQRIIHYYPDEQDAYLELIALAHHAGDERLAEKYIRAFTRHFRRELPQASPPELPRVS